MVVINLYGILESVAQRSTRLRTTGFDESMRALFANFPRLRSLMQNMRVSVLVDGRAITFEDCLRPLKSARIDVMPIVGGCGPAIPIIIGALMSYGAPVIAGTVGTALGLGATAVAALSTFIANMGMALIIGGISQMLFKPPKADLSSDRPDTAASYTFNGAVNTTTQGNIVPVGFGRMRVGSQVVAVNIQTFDIPVDPQGDKTPPPEPPVFNGIPVSLGVES